MGRNSDWSPVGMDEDPTPGDPERISQLADRLLDFADDVAEALRQTRDMAGDGAIAEFVGETADAFAERFEDVPTNLTKLQESYELAGLALQRYWPLLESAQYDADTALDDAEAAREELATAQDWLSVAAGALETAQDDEDEEPEGPDEEELRGEVRRAVEDATTERDNAQSAVDSAQSRLDAATRLAEQARAAREEAAERCTSDLEAASDAGMQNKSWWEKVTDWVSENWDTIMEVVQVIATVLAIVALFVGGPLVWGLMLAVSLIILADTLVKYANGEASLWDVGFAMLDCIPGGRFVGRGASVARTGLARTTRSVAGEADDVVRSSRQADNLVTSADPVDFATGEVVLPATDVSLPGVLPLLVERHHRSTYHDGRWFGPNWASTLDQRLVLDDNGVRYLAPDAMVLHYPRPLPDPDAPVLPLDGPAWALAWDGRPDGEMTIHQPDTGRTLRFTPAGGGRELLLTTLTDRNGNTLRFFYDDAGAPEEIAHSGGYRIGVATYNRRVTSLRLMSAPAEPILIAYDYDDAGHLTHVFNSSGLPLTLTYDAEGRLTSWRDRNDTWYRYDYDGHGRCVLGTGTDRALELAYTYDPDHHRASTTPPDGHTTTYEFTPDYQLAAVTDPLGHTTRHHHDAHGRPTAVTDPLGRTTAYAYDDAGHLTTVTRPDGHTIHTEYNELGLPTQITEADGAVWHYAYDLHGNRTTTLDPAGHRTRYTHHTTGALATITDPLGLTTRVQANPAGLVLAVTDPAGGTTTVERDAYGRTTRVTDPLGATTRFAWTPESRLRTRTDPLGSTERWEWDPENNLLTHTDPNGGATRYTYGAFDVLTSQTDADGIRHAFTRDTSLQLTRVTNPQGLTWDYTYDDAGRLTTECDFDGRTSTFTHDAAGQLTAFTNAAGQTISYTHNPLGNIVTKTLPGDQTTTYTRDAAGRVTHATAPGVELARSYDPLGNLLTETVNGRTLTLAYDPTGQLTQRTTPTGHTSTWTHTAIGRPATLTTGGRTLTFDHDPKGQETARATGDLTLTHTWDPAGRLATQTAATPTRQIHRRTWTYRPDHYPTTLTDPAGTTRYALDPLGRVTAVTGPDIEESYAYDPAGNQTAAHYPTRDPDPVGPRTYTGTLLTAAGHVRYRHDRAGRVTSRSTTRLSKKPATWHYTWDADDQLTACTTPDGTTWRYRYDPFGRRIAKQRLAADGVTVAEEIRFVWHEATLAEQTATTTGATLTWDHRGLTPLTQTERSAASGTDERFYAIVTDLVGTPTHLLDESGGTVRHTTTLWGTTPAASPSPTPLRFPGQYADDETGWHYNLHRHYDPATARYTAPDPLGLAPAPNPQAYVLNPHTWIDPLGLSGYNLPEGYTPSPALRNDPYHPDSVNARRAEWRNHFGDQQARAAQREVRQGRGPREIHRIDGPEQSVPGSQWHAQREGRGSPALNQDGTFHDGNPNFSRRTVEWLQQYGWEAPIE